MNLCLKLASLKTALAARLVAAIAALSLLAAAAEAAPVCEVVFAPTPIRQALVATLKHASPVVRPLSADATLAQHFQFSSTEFAREWHELVSEIQNGDRHQLSSWTEQTTEGAPLLKIRLKTTSRHPLRVLVTAGVHGNEPIGVVTALDLARAFAREPGLVGRAVELTVLPALNFEGLTKNQRRLADGRDLNRDFASENPSEKTAQIQSELIGESFDLALDLHGANNRRQFFVIKQGADDQLAAQAIEVLEPSLRLHADNGQETGSVGVYSAQGFDPLRYHLEAAGVSTSNNEGTLKSFMAEKIARDAYTLEYPGKVSLAKARAKNLQLAISMIRRAALKPSSPDQ